MMNESLIPRRIEIEEFSDTLGYPEVVILATIMATICLFTVVGNLLVLISFSVDKKLRTLNNYFVLSLAISDTMIGVFSMPLFTLYALNGEWLYGPALCDMWLSQDYTCSCASSLNLLVIAFDRYFSVISPLRYRAQKNSRLVGAMIGGVWTLSFLMWPPWIYGWQFIEGRRTVPDDDCYVQFLETNTYATFITSAVTYYLPVTIIAFLYFRIWTATVERKRFLATMESRNNSWEMTSKSIVSQSSQTQVTGVSKTGSKQITRQSPPSSLPPLTKLSKQSKCSGLSQSSAIEYPLDDSPKASASSEFSSNQISPQHQALVANSSKTSVFSELRSNELSPENISQVTELSKPMKRDELNSSKPSPSHQPRVELSQPSNTFPEKAFLASSSNQVYKTSPLRNEDDSLTVTRGFVRKSKGSKKQDNKAAKMLAAILCVFFVTATPYNILVTIMALDPSGSIYVPDSVWFFVYYLFYINSALDPICYALANQQFRKTYWQILKCNWTKFRTAKKYTIPSVANL